jgi:HAD superfamily hydrolase (TIGR01490 family)
MSSPEQIGAFFDLDGTLLPAPTLEWRFIAWLVARDEIDGRNVRGWLGHFARKIWLDPYAATLENKRYLSGLPESLAADWERSLAPNSLRFARLGVERVAWHEAQGHRVFLVSGTLAPLGRVAARLLPGTVEVSASELETRDGRWTGRLVGDHLRGEAKALAVRELARRNVLDLRESYAYGNGLRDLPMLQTVGHAVAVNPEVGLERIARAENEPGNDGAPGKDWRVCVWKTTEPSGTRRLVSVREPR